MTLNEMKQEADKLWSSFLTLIKGEGYADQWDWYRHEAEASTASASAHDAYIKALHSFYLARDGERGVLGGRGL